MKPSSSTPVEMGYHSRKIPVLWMVLYHICKKILIAPEFIVSSPGPLAPSQIPQFRTHNFEQTSFPFDGWISGLRGFDVPGQTKSPSIPAQF